MDTASVIADLEREWEFESGFFGRLRRGEFDRASLSRLIQALDLIDAQGSTVLNRRVVSLLWYVPIFMGWQADRVQEAGGDIDEFDKATTRVQNAVERILGVP